MRVVFVIPYFHDAWSYGGQPRSAFEMAKGLVGLGHSVEVLTTDSGGPHRLDIPGDGLTRVVEGITIRYYRNLSNTLAFRYRAFLPLKFLRDVELRVRDADVVHIHELRSLLSVSAANAANRLSIPFVISPHGGIRHLGRRMLKAVYDYVWGHRILRSAAAVIAVSPVEERDVAAMEANTQRIFRVSNSVPPAPLASLPAEGMFRAKYRVPSGPMLLFLGRLHRVKGADLLVEAFAGMCRKGGNQDAHLVIAGPDDGQGQLLRSMVSHLKIGDRVTFTGYLDQEEKLGAIVDSRLVVIPSRSEVFAISAIEALMCSRPVLVSSACGLFPAPGRENGVQSFEANSIEDLQAQLPHALGDSELFQNAVKGRAFAVREFSPEALAVRLADVYRSVGKVNG